MSTPSDPSDRQPLRQRHADLTRRAILDAARALFADHGYVNTPIRRVADVAGVAVQTIYSTFGSKPAVLVGLMDLMDQQMVEPVLVELMQAQDPGRMLDLVAALERHVREGGADVIRLI